MLLMREVAFFITLGLKVISAKIKYFQTTFIIYFLQALFSNGSNDQLKKDIAKKSKQHSSVSLFVL